MELAIRNRTQQRILPLLPIPSNGAYEIMQMSCYDAINASLPYRFLARQTRDCNSRTANSTRTSDVDKYTDFWSQHPTEEMLNCKWKSVMTVFCLPMTNSVQNEIFLSRSSLINNPASHLASTFWAVPRS